MQRNRKNVIKKNIAGGRQDPRTGGTQAPPGGGRGPAVGNRHGFYQGVAGNKGLPKPKPQGGPASPATPSQPAMPWDVAAANSEAAALKRASNQVTGLDASWLRSQQAYGLEGPWADYKTNPYSRAALLQRSYDIARRGTTNSAGLQLYAGSYINAQNSNTHEFNLGRDELQKAYAEAQAQNIAERQGAEDDYRESLTDAGWDRVYAGLEAEPEPAPAGKRKKKPKKKGKR